MKKLTIIAICLLAVFMGCSKIKQAKDAVKTVTRTMDAAKDAAKAVEQSAEQMAKGEDVELTEESLRKYYRAIKKLAENHPDIEFESHVVAAMQAGMQNIDLEKVIEKETDLTYMEYNEISAGIMAVMAMVVAVEMPQSARNMLAEAVENMEKMDTSALSDEEKMKLAAELEKQKEALAEVEKQLQSSEYLEKKETVEMLQRVREEMAL